MTDRLKLLIRELRDNGNNFELKEFSYDSPDGKYTYYDIYLNGNKMNKESLDENTMFYILDFVVALAKVK